MRGGSTDWGRSHSKTIGRLEIPRRCVRCRRHLHRLDRHPGAGADLDIFDREKIAKGLESLRKAYGDLGYINFTSIPNTQVDDERQSISLVIDIDEDKQFFVSSVNVLGLNEKESQNVLKDLLLKRGDIYNQRLLELFLEKQGLSMPGDLLDPNLVLRRLDQQEGTVALTFDLGHCPIE